MTRQNTIPSIGINGEENNVKMIPALIPFWDMANHDENGFISTQFNDQTLSVESTAIRDFRKDEQIFIYYGKRTATEMLVNNGFFAPQADFGMWIQLPGGEKDYRKSLYVKAGFDSNNIIVPISHDSNPVSGKFLAVNRIFVMDEETVNLWMDKANIDELYDLNYRFSDQTIERKMWQNILIRTKVNVTKLNENSEILNEKINELHIDPKKKKNHQSFILKKYREIEINLFKNVLNFVENYNKQLNE